MQQAQPIGVEQGVVVFGVPRQRFDTINGRFRNEADTHQGRVRRAARIRNRVSCCARTTSTRRARCGRSVDAAGGAAPAPVIDLHEEEQRIDLNELVDAPDVSPPPDTVARLVSDLGAQVVEERPRD